MASNTVFETTLKKIAKKKINIAETKVNSDNHTILNWIEDNIVKDSPLYKHLQSNPINLFYILYLINFEGLGCINLRSKIVVLLEKIDDYSDGDLMRLVKSILSDFIDDVDNISMHDILTSVQIKILNKLFELNSNINNKAIQCGNKSNLNLHNILLGRDEKQLSLKASILLNKIKAK